MASSHSQENNYSQIPLHTPDFQLISTALSMKQQKLDVNRQKLQQARDQFGALDVVKEEDREYLDERLQQITDITNRYAGADLSNDAFTNSLVSNMGQVLDENVKSAVISTKILRNEQAEWAEKRKKGDGSYSDDNYAFAMQRANQWMNNGKTGTAYNGGGGFIKYVDPRKEINEKLPEALKIIREKNKTTQYSKGAGDLIGQDITYDSVSKAEVDAVLESLLSGEARQQLRINAWSQYKDVSEENISTIFSEKRDTQLESINSKLETAQASYKVNKDENVLKEIEYLKNIKSTIEDNDFNTVKDKVGLSGIYTNMYYSDFKNTYTDLYSGTRVVDKKLNELDKFNYNLQLKMEDLAIKRERLDLERMKAGIGSGETFIQGAPIEVQDDPNKNSVFDSKMKKEREILDGISTSLKEAIGTEDQSVIDQITRSKEFSAIMMSDLAGKKDITITVGGQDKKIPLTKEMRIQILDLKDIINDPIRKEAYTGISTALDKTSNLLGMGLLSGDSEDYNIPNINLRYTKTDAGWTLKKVPYKKGENYYASLLRKKASGKELSEKAKKDLRLFNTIQLLNDGNIGENRRLLVKDYLTTTVLSDVDTEGMKKVDLKTSTKNGTVMPNSYSKITSSDLWLSEFGKGDIKGNAIVNSVLGAGKLVIKAGLAFGQYTGDITEVEAKPYLDDATGVKGIDDLLFDNSRGMLATVERNLDEAYKKEFEQVDAQNKTLQYINNKDKYNRLAALADFRNPSKADIVIKTEVLDGVPTGNFVAQRYTGKGNKDQGYEPQYQTSRPMKAEEIFEADIAFFDTKVDNRYNATKPYARTINLGTGSYTGVIDIGLEEEVENYLLDRAKSYNEEVEKGTKDLLSNYEQGLYEVKLEPLKERVGYFYKVYNKNTGEEPLPGYVFPSEYTTLSPEKIANLLDEPKSAVDGTIFDFIQKNQDYLRKKTR